MARCCASRPIRRASSAAHHRQADVQPRRVAVPRAANCCFRVLLGWLPGRQLSATRTPALDMFLATHPRDGRLDRCRRDHRQALLPRRAGRRARTQRPALADRPHQVPGYGSPNESATVRSYWASQRARSRMARASSSPPPTPANATVGAPDTMATRPAPRPRGIDRARRRARPVVGHLLYRAIDNVSPTARPPRYTRDGGSPLPRHAGYPLRKSDRRAARRAAAVRQRRGALSWIYQSRDPGRIPFAYLQSR